MTVAENLQELIDAKADIKSAIESKGVEVTGGLTTYADAIREIEGGSGDVEGKFENGTRFTSSGTIKHIPLFDTSHWTTMNSMFEYCGNLLAIPLYDTSNVTNMERMFYGCKMLRTIPSLDFSNASVGNLFYDCWNIRELPDINCAKASNMSGMLYRLESVHTIGKIYCDALTSASSIMTISYPLKCLINFGGFHNLGMPKSLSSTSVNGFMTCMPNLSRESLLNVLNELYDRKTAGYSVLTLKMHENHFAKLSDADIAIATNKGWTLS